MVLRENVPRRLRSGADVCMTSLLLVRHCFAREHRVLPCWNHGVLTERCRIVVLGTSPTRAPLGDAQPECTIAGPVVRPVTALPVAASDASVVWSPSSARISCYEPSVGLPAHFPESVSNRSVFPQHCLTKRCVGIKSNEVRDNRNQNGP